MDFEIDCCCFLEALGIVFLIFVALETGLEIDRLSGGKFWALKPLQTFTADLQTAASALTNTEKHSVFYFRSSLASRGRRKAT